MPHFEIWGEGLVISAQHRRGKGLAVGDVVSYKVPVSEDSYAVKRVLGLPGDYVLVESPDADRGRAGRMIQVSEFPAGKWGRLYFYHPGECVRREGGGGGVEAGYCELIREMW